MADDPISEEVRRFISEYIDSVELLEVLLLLRRDPKREWSADAVSREIRSNPTSVMTRLNNLHSRGLLLMSETPTPLYRYQPKTDELDLAIKGLAQAYTERQARVIDLIFSKPIDMLRHFSDAFKFKKDDKNG